MGARRRDELADSTREYYDRVRARGLSPRVRLALRLHTSAIARTQGDAARAAGIAPNYLNVLLNVGNPKVDEFIAGLEKKLDAEAVDMRALTQAVGRRAFRNMAYLMENGAKDEVRLRAAQDLMDRSNELAKTQKHEIQSVHLGTSDVDRLMDAMIQSAELRGAPKMERIAAEGYTGGDLPEHVNALLDNADRL